MTIDCLDLPAMTLAATIKGLKARARAIAKRKLHGPTQPGAHFEIAMRRIADAQLFADRNPQHAVNCCWEARHHLNHCEYIDAALPSDEQFLAALGPCNK